jgi:hypothetical protein
MNPAILGMGKCLSFFQRLFIPPSELSGNADQRDSIKPAGYVTPIYEANDQKTATNKSSGV